MNKEPTTYGLNREKVVRILQIGSKKEELEHKPLIQENTAELLRDHLAQPFLSDFTMNFCSSGLSKIPCHPAALIPLETIGDLLCDPNTTTSVLKRLKKFGRSLFSKGKIAPQRNVGLAIYYGAIANALIFHDVRITRLSYLDLHRSFMDLASKEWMPPQFQSLFRRAHEYCKAKSSRYR
ncbi:MAG: hypothetical protein RQ760_01880 [Sedimentisphaerales bacterium]|nr:hypothetical protein [Sedimentisphaerales bacterium]